MNFWTTNVRDFYRFNSADEDQKIVAQSVGDRVLLALSSPAFEVRYDPGDGTLAYVGYALPGTLASDSAWQVIRLDFTGGAVVKKYANNDPAFDKTWDVRTSYTF